MLQQFGLQAIAPQLEDHCFMDWWAGASSRVSEEVQKGVNSIIILGAWLVWKHRNVCVFDGGLLMLIKSFQFSGMRSSSGLQLGLEEFPFSSP